MKKRMILAIAPLLALSLLAGCGAKEDVQSAVTDTLAGGGEAPSSAQAPTGSAPDSSAAEGGGQAMDSLINWMMDGTFSYDFTMTTEGPEGVSESSGSMAMDGDNYAVTTETTVEGQAVQSRVILKDGVMYLVDDASRFIMELGEGMNPMQGMMTDYSAIEKTGEGSGEIDGRTLPYEEYTDSETGGTVRYYLDGGQVVATESEFEGYRSVMMIRNASNSVPAGAFDLPTDYMTM